MARKRPKVVSIEQHLRGKFSEQRRTAIGSLCAAAHEHGVVLIGVVSSQDNREDVVSLIAHDETLGGRQHLPSALQWAIEALKNMRKSLITGRRLRRRNAKKSGTG